MKTWSAADFERDNHRFCDAVMKGGVTSGIVYPPAIAALASQFYLHSIGGTSVGAIAAAIAAAAEFRRRQTGSGEGYALLSKLPNFLTRDGVLLKLFSADPRKSESLLRVALALVGNSPLFARLSRALAMAVLTYIWILLPIAIVITLALWPAFAAIVSPAGSNAALQIWNVFVHGVVPALVWLFVLMFTLLVAFMVHCIGLLASNDFGWCHAYDADGAKDFENNLRRLELEGKDITELSAEQTPRLFDWLDAFIAKTIARCRAEPLTFGELRKAKLPAWYLKLHPEQETRGRGIDFRMVTTCLTLGRPYGVPFDENDTLRLDWTTWKPGAQNLFFLKSDFEKYFPAGIVAHMTKNGALDPKGRAYRVGAKDEPVYCFPTYDDLPILVGVRMSMSFPVLFCAVRLFTPDPHDEKKMRPLWFTDGGLSSNFPNSSLRSPATSLADVCPRSPRRREHQSHSQRRHLP